MSLSHKLRSTSSGGVPPHTRGKAMRLLEAFGLDTLVSNNDGNLESLYARARRMQANREAQRLRAYHRIPINAQAKISRRANRGQA